LHRQHNHCVSHRIFKPTLLDSWQRAPCCRRRQPRRSARASQTPAAARPARRPRRSGQPRSRSCRPRSSRTSAPRTGAPWPRGAAAPGAAAAAQSARKPLPRARSGQAAAAARARNRHKSSHARGGWRRTGCQLSTGAQDWGCATHSTRLLEIVEASFRLSTVYSAIQTLSP